MKRFLFLLFILSAFTRLFAVPAYPYPVVFTQPNGEQVTIIMQGDEFVKFAQTLDGYTLLYNAEGYFCYAQLNAQGDIEPSAFYAEDIAKRNATVSELLARTPKELRFSNSQASVYQQIRNMVENEGSAAKSNTTGVRKLLTVLMQYPDKPFIMTQEDFDNMFNQIKYTEYGANGSVKDFFLEVSYNKLEVQTTVVGPFTAKNNHAYYGDFWQARELAREGVLAAHAAGINFTDFATGGEVPSFYMIFAGHGEEAGGGANCIWSHAWSIDPLYLDGVRIASYACSPELRGGSGRSITHIGVICHEFGHSLGAPDYYDTDGATGGSYTGTGNWDLMASGSWNDGGRTPAPPNPHTKVELYGWATAIALNSAQTVTIPSARFYDNAYFRINTQTPNEYYVLENKIRGGYNDYIPGVNMLIYHRAANTSGMNTTSPQKFYPVAANAPVDLPGSGSNCQADYGAINSALCPWPGVTGKTEFTDHTIPAMLSWNRQPTGKPITNITVHNDYITFDVLGGGQKDNHTVFIPNYYGCIITPESGFSSPVATGGDFEFKVTLSSTHDQSTLVVKSNGQILTSSNDVYTISNIQSDQVVVVEGVQFNSVNIIASAEENGTIFPGGTVAVPIANLQRFDITPNIGFSVDEVFVDGASVGSVRHYVFKNVTEPHTISARFKYGDKYSIDVTSNVLQFAASPGTPSETEFVIVTSPELASSIRVAAPEKFEISNNGEKWYKTFTIGRTQLPYKLYIRYNPDEEDKEHALEKLTLCATDAYTEIILIGNLTLQTPEKQAPAFAVYPNPTTGELQIMGYELRITDIEIYDMMGRKQKAEDRKEKEERRVNISHLPAGIYVMVIRTSEGLFHEKIIKH
ncbi:MAG: M6 family metalloprotease domain-containing protein [Bacteroidetes bacterium]|nr:M6 family metalloprotease domain-containing protein [Bacteroidota bacterium]MCL2302105.1 M6 family metalloprotease domain-containing protein [Lentimicrobiaceae bacterium]